MRAKFLVFHAIFVSNVYYEFRVTNSDTFRRISSFL